MRAATLAIATCVWGCAASPSSTDVDTSTGSATSSSSSDVGSDSQSATSLASSTETSGAESSTGEPMLACGDIPIALPAFATPEATPAAGHLIALAAVDADDHLDAVLVDVGVAASVVLGAAEGAWGETKPIAGAPYLAAAVIDGDHDAFTDLVAVTPAPYRLVFLSGSEDATFVSMQELDLDTGPPIGVAALDVDADDDDDVFVALELGARLVVRDTELLAPVSLSVGMPSPAVNNGDIEIGELDDVPGDDALMHGFFRFDGDGMGSIAYAGNLPGTSGGYATSAALDGDALADVALVEISDFPAGATTLSIALGTAAGFESAVDIANCEWCGNIHGKPAAVDVNADEVIDIVYPGADGIGILLGCGDGTFAAELVISFDAPLERVLAEDVDGDGSPDLVASAPDMLFVARGM